MKIKKIDIRTDNESHFTDIAMLVGNIEFLNDINSLRERIDFEDVVQINRGKMLGEDLYINLNVTSCLSKGITDQEVITHRLSTFNTGVENILKKYNRNSFFKRVVEYATLAGVIPPHVYFRSYFDVIKISDTSYPIDKDEYHYAIVLSPRATQEDVLGAFETYKSYISTKNNHLQYRIKNEDVDKKDCDAAINRISLAHQKFMNSVSNISDMKIWGIHYKKYLHDTKKDRDFLDSIGEINPELEDIRDTKKDCDFLDSNGEIKIDLKAHKDILDHYHKGHTYFSADTSKFRAKGKFKRTLEWYWISQKDIIEGTSNKEKDANSILEEWRRGKVCTVNSHQNKKDESNCEHCANYTYSDVTKALSDYEKVINSYRQ